MTIAQTNPFYDVLTFMRIGHPDKIGDHPSVPDAATIQLCINLIREEVQETMVGIREGDLVEIADGIADSIYVLIFAAHAYGIPIEGVWNAVQRANMAKFPGGKVLRRESDGKIMKPEGWKPPPIAAILEGDPEPYGPEDDSQ